MAITNKDIEKLSEHFATKKDLERFATKEDLERFATKADLESFRAEVRERFATKEEAKQYRDDIMNGLDKVMGELQKSRDEKLMMKVRVDRVEQRLEDHIKLPAHTAV